jgi:HSP20 family protein
MRLSDKWSPSFPSWIDKFFEGDMMDWNTWNFAQNNTTLPAVNIRENEDEYLIEVAAPGLKKSDFQVNYDNGRLTISSEKREEVKKDDEKMNRCEFSYQSFQRSFNIPETHVNAEKIEARYHEGILYLSLPKRDEIKPKPAKEIKIL